MTGSHVRMLRGIVGVKGRVVLVFDSDAAGIKAAERSIEIFAKEYMDAYILILEAGHDPDSFLNEYGTDQFRESADGAMSTVSFLIESAVKRHGLSPEGKIRIVTDIQKSLLEIEDPVARSLHVKSLCERIDVDEHAVLEKIDGAKKDPKAQPNASVRDTDGGDIREPDGNGKSDTRIDIRALAKQSRMESRIIAMMVQFPAIIDAVRNRCLVELFENQTLKMLCRTILEEQSARGKTPGGVFNRIESDELRALTASLAIGDEAWDEHGCMRLISQFEASRTRKSRSLLKDIKAAEESDNPEALNRLLREKMEQARQKRQPLKRRRNI
jgi:DNA primase